jgi:membrane associated rhomboid family serine protease
LIPVRDTIPNVHRPVGVYLLIALNTLVFLFESSLAPRDLMVFFQLFGVVPRVILTPDSIPLVAKVIPFFSYMFVHAGLGHFLMNMWVMWIFADNVEDVMGTKGFLVFYVCSGLAALVGHLIFNPNSMVPVVGASGAIAGVMGAYLILYPKGRVTALIPIIIIPYFVDLPAAFFLSVWFALQVFSGLAAEMRNADGGGVAFMAHAAGFVAGVVLLPFFRKPERCYYCYDKSAGGYIRKDP